MAKDRVVKAEILCHTTRQKDVLASFEKTGNIHLIDMSSLDDAPFSRVEEADRTAMQNLSASLEKVIPFLQDRQEGGRKKVISVVTVEELSHMLQSGKIQKTVSRTSDISDQLADLSLKREEMRRRLDFVSEWSDFPLRFDKTGGDDSFTVRAGQVSSREGFAPLKKLQTETELFYVTELSGDRAIVAWHRDSSAKVLAGLTEAGFVFADFSGFTMTPAEELKQINLDLDQIKNRIKELSQEADSLVEKLPELKTLSDATGLQALKDEAACSGRSSKSTLLMHLWVREGDLPDLKKSMEGLGEAEVFTVQAEEGETPPVFLSESAATDPYLMLTDMYGRPDGADPDPTPLIAPFYSMFFGICIGDAGYGLALAAGSAVGWYLTGKRQGNTRLFRLMFQGGLASIFWGILLGGWFGIAFNSLPSILQAAAMPLNNLVPGYIAGGAGFALSNQFLYLTLGFGLVQLTWGAIVNLKKRLSAGEGISAVIDQSGWLLAILGLFPWLFNQYLLDGALYPTPGIWDSIFLGMLGTGAVLIFVMGGKEADGIGGKVGLGAYACYGIVNLLGDVLSYSRLFALALSSAIIASVINQIAGMLQSSVPVLGIVLAVLFLMGGHLFNIAMAVLSGFIHTARLQFVEFFNMFYDGTGVPFRALRYEPRYVRIKR